MRKVITIGESVLDTVFRNNQPVRSFVGGRIPNAAATLGSLRVPCSMVSECTTDRVGDIIVGFLADHGVDTRSIDRYPDGATPFSAIFEDDGEKRIINYGVYPKERFDVVWPRIDENDILLFGSLYAVDLPQRERVFELVRYAAERKAVIVYLPGFQHGIGYRITHVMPHLLENIEIADIVVANDADMAVIFPGESCRETYHNHIEFYHATYLHLHSDLSVSVFSGRNQTDIPSSVSSTGNLLGWQSGFIAGIIHRIVTQEITKETLTELSSDDWCKTVTYAHELASQCAESPENSLRTKN